MKKRLKHMLRSALVAPGARAVLRPFRAGIGTIFMLHRFSDPETRVVGHDPEELRRTLGFLRQHGYELVELGELFRRLKEGDPRVDLGIAFTLDDGYADQVRIAGPAFAEFDCPATIFVTTGFLDGNIWFWWDRIAYVFAHCTRRHMATSVGGESVTYSWRQEEGPSRSQADFTGRCKLVLDAEKHEAIKRLAEAAEVDLPQKAPDGYAPMTWPELRTWEDRGLTFGPHTVTHPILARATEASSRQEIEGSWNRLRAEARRPADVFCYPNGQSGDFGPREIATLRAIGLQGAVVGTPAYASATSFRASPEAPFTVGRFNYPGDQRVASQYFTGLERLRLGMGSSS